ncbi:MAG: PQQ-binding-like beta-propeller repeat protein [Deltaproteobacteria bacterium]|nr:PQQ-binding-like beta-propeller repeat protein [Deltaproteobacteria bacterium]
MTDYREAIRKVLYIGTNEHVVCLDQASGEIVWKVNCLDTGTIVNLLLADGRIWAATSGRVACLEPETGRVIWRSDVQGLSEPVTMALDLAHPGGQLILSCCGLVFSLVADTGTLMWKNELTGLGYHHTCLRVPGATHEAQPFWRTVSSGKSTRTEVLEDKQR